MKIKKIDFLIQSGNFGASKEFEKILDEVKKAIYAVVWPEKTTFFRFIRKKWQTAWYRSNTDSFFFYRNSVGNLNNECQLCPGLGLAP